MTNLTVEEKAAMWDALMSCQRIRVIGHATLGDPTLQHMGLELWATVRDPVDDSHSRETFTTFVQAMRPKPMPKMYSQEQRRQFQEIFGVNIRVYWNNLTGFDVIKFDDLIKPPDGTSTKTQILKDYGQEAVEFIESLIGISPLSDV